MFSFSVLLVFAFLKVFVEQYLLRPTLERFGWALYRRTINDLKAVASANTEMRGDI
jgi:hypothetical protein